MLNIELTSYGLDDTLRDIMDDLESAMGNNISKRRKDEIIYKILGTVNALCHIVQVVEVEDVAKDESESE